MGEHNLASTGEGSLPETTIDLLETNWTLHENYDDETMDNDIAVIELPEVVDLNIYTPACMARSSDTNSFDGKKALA